MKDAIINDGDVINNFVKNTNIHGSSTHWKKWQQVDHIEVQYFSGLLLNAGLNKQCIMSCEEFWHLVATFWAACQNTGS